MSASGHQRPSEGDCFRFFGYIFPNLARVVLDAGDSPALVPQVIISARLSACYESTPFCKGRSKSNPPNDHHVIAGPRKQGDLFLCYLVKLSRWCGYLRLQSEAFEDLTPIFAGTNDPFPVRFKVKQRVLLDFEYAIPIEQPDLWNSLSFTKRLPAQRQDTATKKHS